MGYRVSLKDLGNMTEQEREAELGALVRAARSNADGPSRVVQARIREFERCHGMSSEQLLEQLRSGEIRETAEISHWLFWIDARDCRVTG